MVWYIRVSTIIKKFTKITLISVGLFNWCGYKNHVNYITWVIKHIFAQDLVYEIVWYIVLYALKLNVFMCRSHVQFLFTEQTTHSSLDFRNKEKKKKESIEKTK